MENLETIINEFQISEIIARAMINRGIDTVPKVRDYLHTGLDSLHDPYLFKGMEQAVKRILAAIERKEKVCVYGDYDVDGITSTAIMVRTLRKLGAETVYYIPNRIEEGYGLSIESIDKVKLLGVNLIITVDCGIKSNEAVCHANSMGMDVIITDHHECEGELPEAFTILDPHQPGCGYPDKDLAGVGVAFKLAMALLTEKGSGVYAENFLDIAAIGTIADVVPLLNENRIIVKNGLARIGDTKNEGIKALLKVCGLNGRDLNTYNVAFMLAPRINAAGRIADAALCVELLLTDNSDRAVEIARELDSDNRERQLIETKILNDAKSIVEETPDFDKDRVIVLYKADWHTGVIGIVASRLTDRFHVPVFIMSKEGELAKGSARSISGFNIFEAMSRYGYLFEKYGGHEMAAGFTIRTERIDELREKMNNEAVRVLGKDKPLPRINIDYRLKPEDITLDTVRQLKLMEPFGTGNTKPVFVLRGLSVRSFRMVGNEGRHLSLTLYDGSKYIKCIAYNQGSMQKVLSSGKIVDVACNVENNIWNNKESVQLNIKDIK